jgi:hypothetical protein
MRITLLCLILACSAHASLRWDGPVRWSAASDLRAPTALAAKAWSSVCGVNLSEGEGGITVEWGGPRDAYTWMELDRRGNFVAAHITVSPQHGNSVSRLLLHEMGHALGMGHSADVWSAMNPHACANHLSAADIAGIRHLYSCGRPAPRRRTGSE